MGVDPVEVRVLFGALDEKAPLQRGFLLLWAKARLSAYTPAGRSIHHDHPPITADGPRAFEPRSPDDGQVGRRACRTSLLMACGRRGGPNCCCGVADAHVERPDPYRRESSHVPSATPAALRRRLHRGAARAVRRRAAGSGCLCERDRCRKCVAFFPCAARGGNDRVLGRRMIRAMEDGTLLRRLGTTRTRSRRHAPRVQARVDHHRRADPRVRRDRHRVDPTISSVGRGRLLAGDTASASNAPLQSTMFVASSRDGRESGRTMPSPAALAGVGPAAASAVVSPERSSSPAATPGRRT